MEVCETLTGSLASQADGGFSYSGFEYLGSTVKRCSFLSTQFLGSWTTETIVSSDTSGHTTVRALEVICYSPGIGIPALGKSPIFPFRWGSAGRLAVMHVSGPGCRVGTRQGAKVMEHGLSGRSCSVTDCMPLNRRRLNLSMPWFPCSNRSKVTAPFFASH